MESQPLQSSGHIVQTAADGRQIMEGQCIEIILLPAHSQSWSGSCIYTLYKWRSSWESPGQKSVWMLSIPSAAESADEYTHMHTHTHTNMLQTRITKLWKRLIEFIMSRSVFNFKGLPECLKRIIFTLLIMKFNCCNIICSQWDVGQKKVIWNLDNGKILTALISVHNEHIHFCWAIPKYSASLEWMGNMMSSFKGGGLQFSFFSLMLISEYYYCILNFSLVFRFYKISPKTKKKEKKYTVQ